MRNNSSLVVIVIDGPVACVVIALPAISVIVSAATVWTVQLPSFSAPVEPVTLIRIPLVNPSVIKLPVVRVIASVPEVKDILVRAPVVATLPVV